MRLPAALRAEIEAAAGSPLQDAGAVGGGCISNTTRVRLASGSTFLKWGARKECAAGMFAAEAESLRVLARAGAVRVPGIIAMQDNLDAAYGWLLLEWLEPGPTSARAWEELGRALALLHRTSARAFGWYTPNFIGSLPQSNRWNTDWPSFWRDERIMPQVERATSAGALKGRDRRRIESMLERVEELAGSGNDEGPALLHGDFWSGNVHGLAAGTVALVDPASYYGHREVDLAMASLFGGFDERFFGAYEEAWPQSPGSNVRRELYQLYFLLVHVNLFGESYVAQTMSSVRKLGS